MVQDAIFRLRAFTLVELLLVLGVLAVITAAATPLTHTLRVGYDADTAVTVYVSSLRRAQILSQTGNSDSAWGVNVATSSITLFKGISYTSRDTNYDEQYPVGSELAWGSLTTVSFAKSTGLPSSTGTTTISVPGGLSRSISISAKGVVTY